MNREQVKDFTRRISQCNRGGMIVVIYDIFFAYVTEAEDAFSRKENEQFQESVRNVFIFQFLLIGFMLVLPALIRM